MNPEKIDYNRINENEIIDDGGIDAAFQLKDLPVYVVYRHGRYKKCFSRDTAINRLAHFMTEKVFRRANRSSRRPDVYREDAEAWERGEVLPEYKLAHARCELRISRLLAEKQKQKRDAERWNKKFRTWAIKHEALIDQKKESEKIYNQLMKSRPY
ncbi:MULTISPECIES: hypothetical protein [Symbiopectobacterium]|uniref:hypothetical protein n=1 Tax=Symbiopectobacterium TaxID=801 RepID=UPI001A24A809|nr:MULTISPECIES: hypothetical protein [Symbiopectobacterium]MBG6247005.1 hypothetical protein [Candidatus Symbiopectobacterium sp. PLON1]MBT9429076.1 hypothetical protein [Candidatus Symbiopectobacterium endolongispinus]